MGSGNKIQFYAAIALIEDKTLDLAMCFLCE